MPHHNTVFAQLLKFMPRHEFEKLAKQHHQGCKLRKLNRWSQFLALTIGQLSGHKSLHDIAINRQAQPGALYHLGYRAVARSSLARVNETQPYMLYDALFSKLYSRCSLPAPNHRFRFKKIVFAGCVARRSEAFAVSLGAFL